MRRGGGGGICNTASVAALSGPGGMCGYAASKHGVLGFTRVAAMENAAHNIRVNALAPGWTETPMVVANSAQNPPLRRSRETLFPPSAAERLPRWRLRPCGCARPKPATSSVRCSSSMEA